MQIRPLQSLSRDGFCSNLSNDSTLSPDSSVFQGVLYSQSDYVSPEKGSAMEPLAVAVHAVSSFGNFAANQSVAVYGRKPVYLACQSSKRSAQPESLLSSFKN
ncbi:hypothetical protein PM082_000679 [Marasmius tenuissimus]|nr:hypothetical protein PM082_000679 [Marasmius tenuissimus]